MRWWKIMRRYVRTWFFLDTCIVSFDWVDLLVNEVGTAGSLARLGKASRTFRILRMVRLLRLVRMREVVTVITERFNSEQLIILADISKLMIVILGMAHLIACCWYGLGTFDHLQSSWVRNGRFKTADLGEKYAMSLHWAVAQFAGGMDEVVPENLSERVFAIVVFIAAFIVASIFVSSLTSSMTQLNLLGSHQAQQLSVLRKYLAQNGISTKLAMRVKRNAQQALREQQRFMPESSVNLLTMVSDPLRVEIHLEMYSKHLTIHPFFRSYAEKCPMAMRKVCHYATSAVHVANGDVIFSPGEIPAVPKMYIISTGTLQYYQSDTIESIMPDQWVSEGVLWTHWMHCGMLVSTGDCRLFAIDAREFQDIAGHFQDSGFDPKSYAYRFVAALNSCEDGPSDLFLSNRKEGKPVVHEAFADTLLCSQQKPKPFQMFRAIVSR